MNERAVEEEEEFSKCLNCKIEIDSSSSVYVRIYRGDEQFLEEYGFCSISCLTDFWFRNLEIRNKILANYELAKQRLKEIKSEAKQILKDFEHRTAHEDYEYFEKLAKIEVR